MIEMLRELDNTLSEIISKHNPGTIVVNSAIACNIKSLRDFRERTKLEIETMMDRTDCINIGYFKHCNVITNSTLHEKDSNVYAYGNTEETCCDLFKIDVLPVEFTDF